MAKTDRRIQRTRELLQHALIELIGERKYDTITIHDIVNRANVGRTTFYKHYNSKDELFMSCHEAMLDEFHMSPIHPLTQEELLSPEIPPEMTMAYHHLEQSRLRLYPIFQGKESQLILRQIRDRSAREIEANLREVFGEARSRIPLNMLANYLAGAQLTLMQWWLEKRRPHTPEDLARTFHLLQGAAIREAYNLEDDQ